MEIGQKVRIKYTSLYYSNKTVGYIAANGTYKRHGRDQVYVIPENQRLC